MPCDSPINIVGRCGRACHTPKTRPRLKLPQLLRNVGDQGLVMVMRGRTYALRGNQLLQRGLIPAAATGTRLHTIQSLQSLDQVCCIIILGFGGPR
jgi:hypothetical protein